MAEPTTEQRKAIEAFVKSTLSPLIESVLTKKLSQAAIFLRDEIAARRSELPAMPEPYAWADAESNRCTRTRRADWTNPTPLFTEEQMCEYALTRGVAACVASVPDAAPQGGQDSAQEGSSND